MGLSPDSRPMQGAVRNCSGRSHRPLPLPRPHGFALDRSAENALLFAFVRPTLQQLQLAVVHALNARPAVVPCLHCQYDGRGAILIRRNGNCPSRTPSPAGPPGDCHPQCHRPHGEICLAALLVRRPASLPGAPPPVLVLAAAQTAAELARRRT